MTEDWRWPILLACQLLLLLLWQLVGSALTPLGFYPYIGGVFLVFAALYLDSLPALLLAAVIGLATDAALPFPFGFSAALYLAGTAGLQLWRHRLRRENRLHGCLIAIGLTAALHLTATLAHGTGSLGESAYWTHAATDLLASLAVTAVIAPWFHDLQYACLLLAGIDMDAEEKTG